MSIAQVASDRGVSPLMSNNPFRNRIASTQPQTIRPVSTNPFLDSSELQKAPNATIAPVPADNVNGVTAMFGSMDLSPKPLSPQRKQFPATNGQGVRQDQVPQRPTRGPPPVFRPLSEEERRYQQGPVRRGTEQDVFADPPAMSKPRERRVPRRNSESSVRDKPSSMEPEDLRKKRETRYKDGKSGKKPSRKLDVIDKLDVTSIYGTGLFHHDGPFDACNPHRNKKKHKLAPMQAFPKDSANMQLGKSGPVNFDYDRYHGYGQEAHIDYNEAAVVEEEAAAAAVAEYARRPEPERSMSFNPTERVDPVHGSETAGLGTSTFLEGAPASRVAMERRDSETENQQQMVGGTLSRKKSVAQKIRGFRGGTNRVQSPDGEKTPASPLRTGRSDSAVNPFFKDYDAEYDRKGQQIAEQQSRNGRPRAPSSPKNPAALERQVTSDSLDATAEPKTSGFLGRMKSLKKTKSRPERREAS